ncbi:MAG: hypothetical protein LUQ07_03005 [Methanospirillum sp.]|nr:hypothetical protein [Methanospirillum sp.]
MADRPLGVTIIGILWILLGLLLLLAGLGLGTLLAILTAGLGVMVGGSIVLLGLITLALGVGCFQGWSWIWIVGVIITGLHLVLGLIGLLFTGGASIVSLIISAIILYYLFQPNVKAWFGQ